MATHSSTENTPAMDSTTTSTPQTQEAIAFPSDLMTLYNLYYTTSRTNATLHQGDKNSPVVYHAQSKLLATRPRFFIHEGSDSGPVVSCVSIPWMGKTMGIKLGDGSGPDQEWATVTRDKMTLRKSDYHFEHDGQTFDWVRNMSNCLKTGCECVDDNGKVYAALLSGGAFNWSKGGEIYVRKDISKELEYLLLAGAIGIWTMEGVNSQSLLKSYK